MVAVDTVDTVDTVVPEPVAAVADVPPVRPRRGRHRRPSSRRPTLYLTAAVVGATGVGLLTATVDSPAQADDLETSATTSVAAALGEQQAAEPLTDGEAGLRIQEMTASRFERDAAESMAAVARAAADQAVLDAAAAAAAEAARPKAVAPVAGARLTSSFGYRWGTLHAGIDLAAPMRTPEYAVMDGVVIEAGPASGYGLAVYIQHENGDVTVYGHMDEILVQVGQTVDAGETIALLGNRGQSTGPHLHLEVHLGGADGEKVDPIGWLRERGVEL